MSEGAQGRQMESIPAKELPGGGPRPPEEIKRGSEARRLWVWKRGRKEILGPKAKFSGPQRKGRGHPLA